MKADKAVRIWLWIGVGMLLVMVILGGITRLTGSGLSITEWDVIMGAIPPLNEEEWNEAFEKYKQIPQYDVLNKHFTLSDFKGIFLWEYLHRLWGRLIGVVFLIPFLVFLFQKKIPRPLLWKLFIAFLLGALQGVIGWIMVMSGLTDRIWVSPLKLTLHLMAALLLIGYMIYIAWSYSIGKSELVPDKSARRFSSWLILGLVVQIALGGLMAGSHAALYYTTWPDMNGAFIPENIFADSPWWMNFMNNVATIQFFHRLVAYLLFFAIIIFAKRVRIKYAENKMLGRLALSIELMVILQVCLGISTLLLSAKGSVPVFWGVLHQLVGLVLFGVVLVVWMQVKPADTNVPGRSNGLSGEGLKNA